MQDFERVQRYLALFGYLLRRVPRAELVRPEKAPDKVAATFDGYEIRVADHMGEDLALFLAVHAAGHCVQFARDPSAREHDPAEHPEWPNRVEYAWYAEGEANNIAIHIMRMAHVLPERRYRVCALMEQDWRAFAKFLGATDQDLAFPGRYSWIVRTTGIAAVRPWEPTCSRGPDRRVRIAAAFDLD